MQTKRGDRNIRQVMEVEAGEGETTKKKKKEGQPLDSLFPVMPGEVLVGRDRLRKSVILLNQIAKGETWLEKYDYRRKYPWRGSNAEG